MKGGFVDDWTFFEGPFDSDEASDAVAELEDAEDVVAAVTEALSEFLDDNQEYVEEGYVESSLAISCLVAARISGIAPDEVAHHWLDRNPLAVDDELRELAAAVFALATRPQQNYLADATILSLGTLSSPTSSPTARHCMASPRSLRHCSSRTTPIRDHSGSMFIGATTAEAAEEQPLHDQF